ncbi:MAG: hypothetical protein JSW50_14320, partial [Candidatus Latescibacterota bacterium]
MDKVKAFIFGLGAVVVLTTASVIYADPATEPSKASRSTSFDTLGKNDNRRPSFTDLIPLSAPTYLSSVDATAELPTVRAESNGLLRYYDSSPAAAGDWFQEGSDSGPRKRTYLPVLLSL